MVAAVQQSCTAVSTIPCRILPATTPSPRPPHHRVRWATPLRLPRQAPTRRSQTAGTIPRSASWAASPGQHGSAPRILRNALGIRRGLRSCPCPSRPVRLLHAPRGESSASSCSVFRVVPLPASLLEGQRDAPPEARPPTAVEPSLLRKLPASERPAAGLWL